MPFLKYKDKKGNSYPYLFIDTKSGIFQVAKRIGKEIRKKSLETSDFNKARSKITDVIYELTHSAPAPKGPVKIFSDYSNEMFLEKKSQGIKPKTELRIKSILKYSIEPYFGAMSVNDISPSMLPDYITWHRRHRPGIGLFGPFKYLNATFRYMVRVGAIPANRTPKVILPKDEQKKIAKKKGRVITNEEISALLNVSNETFRLILSLGYFTGMRKMEICSLEISKIEKKGPRYFIHLEQDDTKTGIARSIPVPMHLNPLFEDQMQGKAKYMFPMASDQDRHVYGQLIDKEWVKAKKDAGIEGRIRFHDTRHTCATRLAQRKENPLLVVTLLGMSIATYQKTYLHLTAEDLIIVSEATYLDTGVTL